MSVSGIRITFEAAASTAALLTKRWGPTLVVVVVSASAGVAWTTSRGAPRKPEAAAGVTAVGRAYPTALGAVYAEAWLRGAESLDAGRSVNDSLTVVADTWAASRIVLFDRAVAPAFAAVVPEGKPDAEVSTADKAALASLWRGFAKGLAEPK